jgi:hypothetical protein
LSATDLSTIFRVEHCPQSRCGIPKASATIATYVLIAIVKKRLNLDHSLYEILRVLDLNMFETTPISALLGKLQNGPETDQEPIQQNLFLTLGH